ncbi:hypothetical protein, partial [Chryseobacterium sp. CH1]|uniref:hypothetical protein n=1 Tax=Chryseobacterium sp. CH1 TaxID=713551 RepID=UPI001E311735
NMNNILGFMAESQIIKTERTTLNALIHYRKFFYSGAEGDVTRNNDFVVGNILYNQQLFRNMNNILGFMAESQIIKTERTTLNALIHYRKFFY